MIKIIWASSHHGQRLRGCQFPPIRLQETKNLASPPFTLEAKSPKAATLQNAYMAILFYQGDKVSKEVWFRQDWKPKLWSRGNQFLSLNKKIKADKILAVRLEGLLWAGNKVGCSFFFWTLGLAFGGFTIWPSKSRGSRSSWPKVWTLGFRFWRLHTLCPAVGSNSYIIRVIFSPFIWTLNKVWPFNPTACQQKFGHSIP
jgi:hypothetical protein